MFIDVIILLLVAHWVGDFLFQKRDWAVNKHHSLVALLKHTTVYTIVFGIVFNTFMLLNGHVYTGMLLFLITLFITHTVVDYFTSKVAYYLHSNNKTYDLGIFKFGFFDLIGLDQLIHYGLMIYFYTEFITYG